MKLTMHLRLAQIDRKRFKQFFFLVLLKILMPTPALGFILGGLITTTLLLAFREVMLVYPFLWALLMGCLVVGFAIAWQVIYDHYWEGAE